MKTFTREQIDAIEVGKTRIAHSIWGLIFGNPTLVVGIHAKREDIHGKLFVCGYRRFGETSNISFSLKEGDEVDARHYRISTDVPRCPARRASLNANDGERDENQTF